MGPIDDIYNEKAPCYDQKWGNLVKVSEHFISKMSLENLWIAIYQPYFNYNFGLIYLLNSASVEIVENSPYSFGSS